MKRRAEAGPAVTERSRRTLGSVGVLTLLAGCNSILGIDKDYYLEGRGGAGAQGGAGATGGDGGAGGATGGGGAGGDTTTSSTTTSSTTTSSTTTTECMPAETQPCYSGPGGTEGVGVCKGGVMTCAPDGQGFGKCEGEVVPAQEVCDGFEDDDCDGVPDLADGCVCLIGVEEPCYTGPAGTAGVAVCQAGLRACEPDGSAWGPCLGEVTPSAEACTTLVDESCDGQSICTGAHVWSHNHGDSAFQFARSVASDEQNNVLVAGGFSGSLGFGGAVLTGTDAMFVTKLNPAGDQVWSKNVGGSSQFVFPVVRADPSSNVVVTGGFTGTLSFGGGALTNNDGSANVFLAKLDPDGAHLWSKQFGDTDSQSAAVLAIDDAGNVLVAGTFSGALDFGGGALTGKVFVAKFDPQGNHVWSKAFTAVGGLGTLVVRGIGADAAGDVVYGGILNGTVNFGGVDLTSSAGDVFVVKLSAAGQHVWSKHFGSASSETIGGLAVDKQGNTVLTGSYGTPFSFGGALLPDTQSMDVYAAKLDSAGNQVWSKGFGDGNVQSGDGVAVDGAGNVVLTGYFLGSFGFGGPPIGSASDVGDTYLAKLDPFGDHVWSRTLASQKDSGVEGLAAADISGNVLFAGGLSGSVSFSGSLLETAGSWDVIVAKFAQ